MEITHEIIDRVKNFGALGLSYDRIISLLMVPGFQKELIIEKLSTPGDELYEAYNYGLAVGDYNKEAKMEKLAESGDVDTINTQRIYRKQKKVEDLKRKLFGI